MSESFQIKNQNARRRNPTNWTFSNVPTNWTFSNVPTTFLFDRGYTGHEHLDAFGLINMNGRVYDPMLGRFLSPDNYVQAPDYSQNFNRYSYVMNNPLKYTDPDGEFFFLPIILGAAMGGVQGYMQGAASGYRGSDMAGSIVTGMIYGAVTSGLGSIASGGMGAASPLINIPTTGALPSATIGLLNGAIAGGLSGGFMSALQGQDFWEGAKWGAIYGGGSGMLTGGYLGFMDAKSSGANPWTGKSYHEIDYSLGYFKGTPTFVENDEDLNSLVENKYCLGKGDIGIKIISMEKTPNGYFRNGSDLYRNDGKQVGGVTVLNGWNHSDIYTSAMDVSFYESFHFTMGHELIHAFHNYLGLRYYVSDYKNYTESLAYKYSLNYAPNEVYKQFFQEKINQFQYNGYFWPFLPSGFN